MVGCNLMNQTEQIQFTKQERKLLLQALTNIEHYGQQERPELRAKIEAMTQQTQRPRQVSCDPSTKRIVL